MVSEVNASIYKPTFDSHEIYSLYYVRSPAYIASPTVASTVAFKSTLIPIVESLNLIPTATIVYIESLNLSLL